MKSDILRKGTKPRLLSTGWHAVSHLTGAAVGWAAPGEGERIPLEVCWMQGVALGGVSSVACSGFSLDEN